MPDHKRRYESMLFNYESTVRTDFRDGEIKPIIETKYKGKETCLRIRPGPLKDIHALTDWRDPNLPFDLFGKPKDILMTNPNDVQRTYGHPIDLERKQVQATRPRLVITPAACLDDVDDRARKILIDSIYTSTQMCMMRDITEAQAHSRSVIAPLPGKPAPANPLCLPKLQPPYVSPEWRMDSVTFDNRQIRAHCLPTQEFWLARPMNCD